MTKVQGAPRLAGRSGFFARGLEGAPFLARRGLYLRMSRGEVAPPAGIPSARAGLASILGCVSLARLGVYRADR